MKKTVEVILLLQFCADHNGSAGRRTRVYTTRRGFSAPGKATALEKAVNDLQNKISMDIVILSGRRRPKARRRRPMRTIFTTRTVSGRR
jgi:hypothetical protein